MRYEAELGLVGAGFMATALCRGILRAGLLRPADVLASDPDPERRRLFEAETGAHTTPDNAHACRCPVVILAVKPQVMSAVLAEIGPAIEPDTLVVSIAAGITTQQIEAASPRALRVVRVMPNMPVLVGEGAAALCRGTRATDDDVRTVRRLFESCAFVCEVDEPLMHAVTALSGSGPAYLFYLAEIMADAGVRMGLSKTDSAVLTRKTLLGAARMLAETGRTAKELRRQVTSPGGTTEAAIGSMERDAVAEKVVSAIEAACRRSRELSGGPAADLTALKSKDAPCRKS